MITLKEWMELVDYRVTEGSDYGWNCYGPNVHMLDSWNGDQDEFFPPYVTVIPAQVQKIWNPDSSTYITVPGGSHRGAFMRGVADQVDWFKSLSKNP